jgi:serine O-acetyltransferase
VPRGAESRGVERIFRFLATILVHPGWQMVFLFRLSQGFHRIKLYPLSWILYRLNMHAFSVDIPPSVELGRGAWLPHPVGIATIAGRKTPPTLGDQVVVGAGACVLGPATLGDQVHVGANSLVTRSFPPGVKVAGVPAKRVEEFAVPPQTNGGVGRDW